MIIPCLSNRGHTSCLLYFFSHDRTIKLFPRIAFSFAGFHVSSAFVGNFDGTFGLMIPDGFGDPIAGFENPDRQAGSDTPHLTVGHTPWSFGGGSTSGRGAFAFASRGHTASTSATHGFGTVEGRTLFLYLFFSFTRVDPVHGLGHGHGHGLGVVRVDQRFASRCGAPKDGLPLHTRWSQYWYA